MSLRGDIGICRTVYRIIVVNVIMTVVVILGYCNDNHAQGDMPNSILLLL